MALIRSNRIKETSTTTGTGTITLGGAVSGFKSFSSGIGVSNTCFYVISLDGDWEVGLGTLSTTTTLTRDIVLDSSNAASLVNFPVGTKIVFVDEPSQNFKTDSNGFLPNSAITGLGTMSTQNASSVAITGGSITGLSSPVNPSDAVTKAYADALTSVSTYIPNANLPKFISVGTDLFNPNGITNRGANTQQNADRIIGLLKDPAVIGVPVEVISRGQLSGTTAEWDAVTGGSGGLVIGTDYFVDSTASGTLTNVEPTPGQVRVRVGLAMSSTLMEVRIEMRGTLPSGAGFTGTPLTPIGRDINITYTNTNTSPILVTVSLLKTYTSPAIAENPQMAFSLSSTTVATDSSLAPAGLNITTSLNVSYFVPVGATYRVDALIFAPYTLYWQEFI